MLIACVVVFVSCVSSFAQNCGTGTLQQPIVSCCHAGFVQASLCVGNLPGNCQDLAGPFLSCTETCGILQAATCDAPKKIQDADLSLHSLREIQAKKVLVCSDPTVFEQWLILKAASKNRPVIIRGL
jgi:hypothetical protein